MRTLDLVDEETSTTTPPMEAAVPDVSETVPTVGTSSEPSSSVPAPSAAATSSEPTPSDGGVVLPDTSGGRICSPDRPFPVDGYCLECRSDFDCPELPGGVDQVCYWGGACEPECKSNDDCREACELRGVCFGPFCKERKCYECLSDADCERFNGLKPICDSFGNYCREECTSNFYCTPDEPICDRPTLTCRICLADWECPSDAPVCGMFGRCVTSDGEEP